MKNLIMLPTAEINSITKEGEFRKYRALIDTGSASSFISSKAAKELNYEKFELKSNLHAIANVKATQSDSLVLASLKTRSTECLFIKATVINKLTDVDDLNINEEKFKEIFALDLADPNFFQGGKIDMIIGASDIPQLKLQASIENNKGLWICNSQLGVLLMGLISLNDLRGTNDSKTFALEAPEEFDVTNQEEWDYEDADLKLQNDDAFDDLFCEELFNETTKVDLNDYVIIHPLKSGNDMRETRDNVFRLINLGKVFEKNQVMEESYESSMKEIIETGQVEEIKEIKSITKTFLAPETMIRGLSFTPWEPNS